MSIFIKVHWTGTDTCAGREEGGVQMGDLSLVRSEMTAKPIQAAEGTNEGQCPGVGMMGAWHRDLLIKVEEKSP